MKPEDLAAFKAEIEKLIDLFRNNHKNRARDLRKLLDARLGVSTPPKDLDERDLQPRHLIDIEVYSADLQRRFVELSSRHIFQWSTFYRETIIAIFRRTESLAKDAANVEDLSKALVSAFADHSHEVFTKHFHYLSNTASSALHLQERSLSGLRRFLELPIESYLVRVNSADAREETSPYLGHTRQIASAMLTGILMGYGSVDLGGSGGWKLLPSIPGAWVHYIAFLRSKDLNNLLTGIEPGAFADGLRESVYPVLRALDDLLEDRNGAWRIVPSLGEFSWESRRLQISLPLSKSAGNKRYLEIQCYLDPAYMSTQLLEEAASRGIDLISSPAINPDLKDWVTAHDLLRSVLVGMGGSPSVTSQSTSDRAADILKFAVAKYSDPATGKHPLTHNFASDFPLSNPVLAQYFRIQRGTVRDLLKASENKSGVRLWCSVRRSGKTTSCTDLETTAGATHVITQTCVETNQAETASVFYRHIHQAIIAERAIPSTFIRDAIEACMDSKRDENARFVFVLDEYETLFERMKSAVLRNRELRYTVVQPILNQIVAFSKSNLVILIGQEPDAHYILMDQNQLSPYIEQDTFPLFEHGSGKSSEFRELVRKIMSPRVEFSDSFIDRVYAETGGHPFLTANMLVDFFDWLIELQWPANKLVFDKSEFDQFQIRRLSPAELRRSGAYGFFKHVVSEAISEYGKKETSWLFSVYSAMRRLVEKYPESMACTRKEFESIVSQLRLDTGLWHIFSVREA